MLESITTLLQIDKGLEPKNRHREFNGTIPIMLKVLEKSRDGFYKVKLGSVFLNTKSQKELEIGKNYWASMAKSSAGAIILSSLKKHPKILSQLEDFPLKFSSSDMKELIESSNDKLLSQFRDFLLERLALSQNRNEFIHFSNLLLSLQREVATFVLRDGERDSLFQIKRRKGEVGFLDFYAIFSNMGEILGRIYRQDSGISAVIKTQFESTRWILLNNIDLLNGFDKVEILLDEKIVPLYDFEDRLLDIKG